MKKLLIRVILPLLICGALTGVSVANATGAFATTLSEGAEAARCDGCPENLFGDTGVFKQVTNIVLYIVGVIAVIMLIIGGIKYVVSASPRGE